MLDIKYHKYPEKVDLCDSDLLSVSQNNSKELPFQIGGFVLEDFRRQVLFQVSQDVAQAAQLHLL